MNATDTSELFRLAGYSLPRVLSSASRNTLRDAFATDPARNSLRDTDTTLFEVEHLISNQFEVPQLRIAVFNAYITDGYYDADLLSQLLKDLNPEVRKAALRAVSRIAPLQDSPLPDRQMLIDSLHDEDSDVAVIAVQTVCHFIDQGLLDPAVLTEASQHRYWLVKKKAIDYLTSIDKPQTIELLYPFRIVSYHASQASIRAFISRHLGQGFNAFQLHLARMILDGFINAKKTTEISKRKNQVLMDRLSEY